MSHRESHPPEKSDLSLMHCIQKSYSTYKRSGVPIRSVRNPILDETKGEIVCTRVLYELIYSII